MQRNDRELPAFSRRWAVAAVAAAAVAVAGAALSWHGHARAQTAAFGPLMHGGWEAADAETIARRIEALTALRLADIDATAEQKSRITAIMQSAARDLAPLREQGRELRRRSVELLAAPTIDRAQLDALRAQQMQLGETASRRLLQALADAAEVLSPEQRARLAERRQQRQPRG